MRTSIATLLPGPPAFFDDGSSFGRRLQRIRNVIADGGPGGVDGGRVVTDMRIALRKGRLRLKALYWSWQSDDVVDGFRAVTLFADGRESTTWRTFPDDPALGPIGAVLGAASDWDVLRYIPGRRLTVTGRRPGGQVDVVKFKKRDRIEQASEALATVRRACDQLPWLAFRVPQLVRGDLGSNHFVQEHCPGVALEGLLGGPGAPALARRLGQVHAQVHALAAAVPPAHPAEVRSVLATELELVGALLPHAAETADECGRRLMELSVPEPTVVCHGDLDADAILIDGDEWSVVDWDRSHVGSRGRDIAICLACEAMCRPADQVEELRAAYLRGYRSASPDVDLSNLNVWLACEELRAVVVAIRKGAWSPEDANARIDRARALSRTPSWGAS